MSHTVLPGSADLSSYITGLNLFDSGELAAVLARIGLADKAAAAAAAWQEQTGWYPFIKDTSDVSRRFDPPGPNSHHGGVWALRGGKWVLDLRAGLLVVTSIVTGYSASTTNPQAGTAQVAEDDYWLLPEEAPLQNRPYTQVEFAAARWGDPRSVRITGRWGFCSIVPEDAWQAVLQYGALLAASDLQTNLTLGMLEYTEAVVTERYGPTPLAKLVERWQDVWDQAVGRYVRVTV
jgi:hypothetical protein